MRQIGLLGGSFDPIHNGHLRLASDVMGEFSLEEVWLVPARLQPLKGGSVAPAEDRLVMCRLAAVEVPGLRVLEDEIRRDGPSYTVDTVRQILTSEPDIAITFVAGTDALVNLPKWKEPAELLRLTRVVAVERGGVSWQELQALLPNSLGMELTLCQARALPISSTDVRERIANGMPITDLVPAAVEHYIHERALYRGDAR
ncbi:MAG: nicotinate (nicotinamide) nucleotide adenylyltransferase [Fimbriimonadia bacterium]